jgi:hypothetical protein
MHRAETIGVGLDYCGGFGAAGKVREKAPVCCGRIKIDFDA